MRNYFYFLFFLISITTSHQTKATNCYGGRYEKKVFKDFTTINDILYGRKQRSDGAWLDYKYDVYQPKNDTATTRPLIFLAHGNAFLEAQFLDKKSPDIVELAIDLVQKGYVVISIEYREEPNPLSLFNEQNMIKAVGRAVLDIRDGICKIMDTTLNYGNPYKIDYNNVIVGGVSAGAIALLHGAFIDNLDVMPAQYKQWILEVEPNAQALLANKYCGATIKGIINISGAILDTNWIQANKQYPPLLSVHGTADPIVPFNYGKPFSIPVLPNLMGSYLINKRYKNLNLRSELDTWISYSHVPFVGGLNLEALLSPNPLAVVFNPYVLDSTKNHIAHFCYSLINCESRTTGIKENIVSNNLSVFPNPTTANFSIQFPKSPTTQQWRAELFDIAGQEIFDREYPGNTEILEINEKLPSGFYFVKLQYFKDGEAYVYTGKINVSR